MNELRETLEKLELLCWSCTNEDVEKKIQDYLKNYPHLRTPACVDLLRQAMKTWQRIQHLEEMVDNTEDPREKASLIARIDRLNHTWLQMLANLGVTFTKQQYISKKAALVTPPIEMLKRLKSPKKEEKEEE